jgi:hypothetical protein
MPTNLIPAADPTALPVPPWLFHALWLVTFLLHLLFVNLVLGGSLLAVVAGGAGAGRLALRRWLVGMSSWTISGAITLGIAPLLFMQVLRGRFFYSATILWAWPWFAMLGLLTVGYYLNYVAKAALKRGREPVGVLAVEALCFVAVAVVQVVVQLLHLQPGRWQAVAGNAWLAFADPTFAPRLLHFLLAAIGLTAAVVALWAVRWSAEEEAARRGVARFAVKVALVTVVLQVVDGLWLLAALPREVLIAFMQGGALTMLPLTAGLLLGLGLVVVLAMARDPLEQSRLVRHTVELMVAAIAVMVLTRHQLRGLYQHAARAGENVAVNPQWGVFALFLVTFLACVALTVWALVRAATDRPAAGEPTA